MSQSQSNRTSFKILVATDNHLGFKENHHIMGDDSFDAFEEVLQAAKRNNVDFLLLGGDLFHELNPSQSCLYRAMSLFQKYVFGSGDLNFSTKSLQGIYPANYLNENLNIDLPIFVIHGNHDYPSSAGENISTLDLLQASHLINYFGKYQSVDEITIEPILFEKNNVKIALYGMGHIKDTRIHYLFEKEKIKFARPQSDDYMNILILHQNRFKGIRPGVPYKNCVHPEMLPDFFDLIIWGNEHESIDELVEDPVKNFYIYQPGSTIATSMNQAESLQKHAGFFEVYEKKNFRFVPIKLKNQRPLFVKNIELEHLIAEKPQKGGKGNNKKNQLEDDEDEKEQQIIDKILQEVETLIEENTEKVSTQRHLKQPPVIRLRVEYTGFDIIRIKQVESRFTGKVANEGDVLKFWRKTNTRRADHKQNEKLNQRFEECLKNKISFDTITSDSSAIISGLLEELIQAPGQKRPKILFNYQMFTQSQTSKFTLQNLNNMIGDSLNFAETKLMNQKLNQLQVMSRKIIGKQSEYVENRMEMTDRYHDEITNQIREYDLQLNQIPQFITSKLQEYSDNKSMEVLGRMPIKEEVKVDEEKGAESDNASSKRKKGRSPIKKKPDSEAHKTYLFEEDEDKSEEESYDRKKSSGRGAKSPVRSRSPVRGKSPVREPPKQPVRTAPVTGKLKDIKIEEEDNPRRKVSASPDRSFDEMLKSKSYQPSNPRQKLPEKKQEAQKMSLEPSSKGKTSNIMDFMRSQDKSKSPSPMRVQEPQRELDRKHVKEEHKSDRIKMVEEPKKVAHQSKPAEVSKAKEFQISPNKQPTSGNSFFKPKGTQDTGFRSKVLANYDENYNSNDYYAYKDKEMEEQEDKDWFGDDFGKLNDISVPKKGSKTPKSSQTGSRKTAASKEPKEDDSSKNKKKKRDSPQRSPGLFLDDEEDDFNPLLKKTKKNPAAKKDKSPDKSPTGRGGKKSYSFL